MKGKSFFTAFSALMLFTTVAKAQVPVVSSLIPKITFGVKFGVNMQELNGTDWARSYNAGYIAGAFIALHKRKIGLQAEALLSSAKIDYNFSGFVTGGGFTPLPTYANFLYFNLPVLFEYKIIPRLWLQIGPQFTDLISAKNNQSYDIKSGFKSIDFGGVLGLQAILPLHFTVSARYVLGLANVNSSDYNGAWNSRSIQIALGFRIL